MSMCSNCAEPTRVWVKVSSEVTTTDSLSKVTRREHDCLFPLSCTCMHYRIPEDGEWSDFYSVPEPE